MSYSGDTLEIGFNAEFLRDGLESVTDDDGALQAHQPAPAGAHPRGVGRLPVPDHADPARRLIVGHVSLRNFRSYAELELDLVPGLVLVIGPNGVGKTNLLEALHVGAQGFSPRTRSEPRLVRFGEDAARVRLRGTSAQSSFETEVDLAPGSREGRCA